LKIRTTLQTYRCRTIPVIDNVGNQESYVSVYLRPKPRLELIS